MLNVFARASVAKFTDPVGAWLVRHRISPDVATVVGTVGASLAAVTLFPTGYPLLGTLAVTFFLLFDLLDGAMARAAGTGGSFGAVLDASCDRVTDGMVFGSLAWWLLVNDRHVLGAALLVCLVAAQVVSYVKARAEAQGLDADGGFAERAERLVLLLTGTGLYGLGLGWALDLAVWVLLVLSVFTVGQRLLGAYRARPGA